MTTRIERLSELASDTAALASRSFSSAQEAASKAGVAALAAGKSTQQAIVDAISREDTKAAVMKAHHVVATVKKVDVNHKEVADKVETVSMGLGITSGVVAAGAALAAPAGLSAVGVALGITSAPLIVAAAPVVGVAATVTGVISGGAYFYSKWKSRKAQDESRNE